MTIAINKGKDVNPDITIVCCYNDEDELSELNNCLEKQNTSLYFLPIDNTKGQFNSCSKAFNSVLGRISTKYVIFSHQDIILPDNDMMTIFIN